MNPLPLHVREHAIGAAMIIAATAAAYITGIHPILSARAQERADGVAVASRREALAALDIQQQSIHARVIEHRRRLEQTPINLQPASELNNLAARLAELAEATGLQVSELAPGTLRTEGSLAVIPIRFVAEAAPHAALSFFEVLFDQVPELVVSRMDMAAVQIAGQGDDQSSGSRTRLAIEFSWYAVPADAPPVAPR